MYFRRLGLLLAAAAGLVAGTAAPAFGKDINWSKIKEVSRKGPSTIDLKDKWSVRIPTGFRLVTEDKLPVYHELMGDVALPDEIGVLLPEEGGWTATITFPKDDPLKDQDPKQLNGDALLKWNEKALDDAQVKRTTAGLPALKITGWTHKPAYDADGKRLTMGMRVTLADDRNSGRGDNLHYKTVMYSPDGTSFVCMQTVAALGFWDKPLEETKKLATEFAYRTDDGAGEEDPMYYAKIGGAGVIGVIAVIFGAKLLGGRRPEPAGPSRSAARRFGTPR